MSGETAVTATAVREIADLAREATIPYTTPLGPYIYARQSLVRVDVDPRRPETLEFYTLAGFVTYLKAEDEDKRPFVHVVSPTRVDAVSALFGADTHLRRNPARAVCKTAVLQGFSFNNAIPLETLSIALQTCFEPNRGQITELRKFCAAVKSSQEIGVADDGVSQTVAAKRGIASVQTAPVNNPWELAPWRTFAEVPQPISPFVLRFSEGEEPRAGLYETGDAGWQVDAVKSIASFLRDQLGEGWKVLG